MSGNIENNAGPDVAVVCAHYNFPGFHAPRRNLHRFIRYIHSLGVPCYGIELYLKGQTPASAGYPKWKQFEVSEDYVLWQKEGIWNACVQFVPAKYQKLIFLDTDIWCSDPKWMRKISASLDRYKAVHPMSHVYAADKDGRCKPEGFPSVVKQGLEPPMQSHPGYGWAVQRSLFNEGINFFDMTVSGNGDWFMAYALLSNRPLQTLVMHNKHPDPIAPPCILDAYEKWLKSFQAWLGGLKNVGYVEAHVFHEYHGTKKDRQYTTRRKMMAGFEEHEIQRDKLGLWTWSDKANPLRKQCFFNYFVNRKEDN